MIRVENLSKNFGTLEVLKNISTEIHKGEIIAIIGPSGSGKSTFLRCLNLLEKPSSGDIQIDTISLLDKNTPIAKLRQKTGMVFQSFNLWTHLSVLENLTLGPIKLLGKSKQESETRAIELLKMVGLAEKVNNFPDELSGGQKQRVAIARCMSMDPEIILFDEPTSALDPTMVSEVLAVIRKLSKEGMTMVIVTHEMEFAKNTATRVFYMDEGTIYEDGSPAQIFENPVKEKTRAFINRIRSLNFHLNSKDYDLYALQGEIENFCEKHLISKEISGYVQLIAEEVFGLMPKIHDLYMNLSYSEKDGDIILFCENAGEPFNPFKKGALDDDIGIRLIEGRCKSVDYRYENDKNILLLDIKIK